MNGKRFNRKRYERENVMNGKHYEWKTLLTEHYEQNVINGKYTQIFNQSVC